MKKGCTLLSVRPVASHEWQRYRDVRLRALQDAPEAFGSTWEAEVRLPDEDWSARTEASALGQAGRGFFAVSGQQVCGLAWCLLSDVEPRSAHLYQMWVDPAARGRGAGRALLAEAIAWARSKGAEHVRLGVTVAESPAMHLYESQGFYPVGDAQPLREGSQLWVQAMLLDLGAGT